MSVQDGPGHLRPGCQDVPGSRSRWSLSPGQVTLLTISVQLGFVAGALGSALLNLPDIVDAAPGCRGGVRGSAGLSVLGGLICLAVIRVGRHTARADRFRPGYLLRLARDPARGSPTWATSDTCGRYWGSAAMRRLAGLLPAASR